METIAQKELRSQEQLVKLMEKTTVLLLYLDSIRN